jgi:hypothetical protein
MERTLLQMFRVQFLSKDKENFQFLSKDKEKVQYQKILNLYQTRIQGQELEKPLKFFKFSQNLDKILTK